MLSHPLLFSLCWPLAKEHIRRNRQSRTFLVENVIGEIWSELEEGSVLECRLPLLDFVCVCVCVPKNAFLFVPFTLSENVPNQLVLQTCLPRESSFWSCNFACSKTIWLFRRKVGAGTHQFQSKPCVKQQVIRWCSYLGRKLATCTCQVCTVV